MKEEIDTALGRLHSLLYLRDEFDKLALENLSRELLPAQLETINVLEELHEKIREK